MKNLLFLVFFLSILLFSCDPKLQEGNRINDYSQSEEHDEPALPNDWSDKLITTQTFQNYEESMDDKIEANSSLKGDARIFGYKWEEFKEYIKYVELKADTFDTDIDSIQFVLTAYEPNGRHNGSRFNTIVVKPTFFQYPFRDGRYQSRDGLRQNNEDEIQQGGFFNNFFLPAPPPPPIGDEGDEVLLDYSGCCPD